MAQTSREIVRRCLKFETPERLPRELWALPWAWENLKSFIEEANRRFPGDMGGPANVYRPSAKVKGDQYGIGNYTDEWGCTWTGIQRGIVGEIRKPLLKDLADWKLVKPPYETLPENPGKARDDVNRSCAASTLFMRANCCPRPWERYQFIRGSEDSMVDMMMQEPGTLGMLKAIHDFHMKELEFWVKTDVDAVGFMDDWGSQRQLLIPPPIWRQVFKPMYKDYCDIAHANGKFVFMHSDGHISEIYPDLVEIGVDALNSQLFCMDMPELAKIAKGKLTFWGEIDRQHVMPATDPQVARDAVRKVAKHFYDPKGGVIITFEATAGTHGPNVIAIFEEWEKVEAEVSEG
jgi:uroporphyrinogen decarboxylase